MTTAARDFARGDEDRMTSALAHRVISLRGQHLVAIGAQRTLGEQYQSSTIYDGGPTDLPDRLFEEFSVWSASH